MVVAIKLRTPARVKVCKQRPRRNASLVSMAKTGTALPLSFEVSRRVRAQSVPEPASLSVLGIGTLLLLRRRGRARPGPRVQATPHPVDAVGWS